MRNALVVGLVAVLAVSANAGVVINEVFINPPGSYDNTREFVELMGTPGMKLDGYALAFVNGMQDKYYTLGSIPPRPVAQEVDEFFSLDGLQLGDNGLLVIGVGVAGYYPTLLDDTSFMRWNTLWNGGLDTVGKLENDGANTVMLIRNRPGRTQADPTNPAGLMWGKDIVIDAELITPAEDPQNPGTFLDQWGNGALDKGEPDNIDGDTLDLRGYQTLEDITDDLEIVDEFSYEHDRGWEYDVDSRGVDDGSTHGGLPGRKVHALDDPQGLNPDVFSRVDYRTKGDGWTPAPGATGELLNGNNWQDTATEQWIRGESIIGMSGAGNSPWFYFSNDPNNTNPDAIQPYLTNVPLWLTDGSGVEYDFSTAETYQIMAGRMNPLATPYIPGDTDRDGDCDQEDIDKLAAVFGDDDWIFSNSFADAPEGKNGDPATQTRPWDVDGTGDNGIEATDLQWVLNFQGDATGQIVGVQYDSTTPATTGVVLNPNTGVVVTLTTSVNVPSGHALDALAGGDVVELTVWAEVTGGANTTTGEENGVMQYVNDVVIDTAGVIKVVNAIGAGTFATTRSDVQTLAGTDGDAGVDTVNGYSTSFANGLSGAVELYTVTLQAVDTGSAVIEIMPATMAKFAASAPVGLKVGHTESNGDPVSVVYPPTVAVTVASGGVLGDIDGDGDVDLADLQALLAAYGSCPGDANYNSSADLADDGEACINLADLQVLLSNYGTGA